LCIFLYCFARSCLRLQLTELGRSRREWRAEERQLWRNEQRRPHRRSDDRTGRHQCRGIEHVNMPAANASMERHSWRGFIF